MDPQRQVPVGYISHLAFSGGRAGTEPLNVPRGKRSDEYVDFRPIEWHSSPSTELRNFLDSVDPSPIQKLPSTYRVLDSFLFSRNMLNDLLSTEKTRCGLFGHPQVIPRIDHLPYLRSLLHCPPSTPTFIKGALASWFSSIFSV